ncbi:MAG TPA: lysylphosphatidylglycerol synthase transmembrane domain-containing protein [Myxococcaceae bacterium]|nr:lysylphosphatidylglycerol synthase transmembrane domain-containing protein [Myxococcaceae bacterium]
MASEQQEMNLGGDARRRNEATRALRAPSEPLRTRVLNVLRTTFALAGVGLLALLVRDVGPEELLAVLKEAAPWLPLVVALELARLATEALGTWLALGKRASAVPLGTLARAQLISTAVASLAPAGRATGEVAKAALFSRYTGEATAMAAAATAQAASLVATGLVSVPCAVAAYLMTGASGLTLALGAHAVLLVLLGTGMRAGMRARRLGAWLRRHSRRFAPHAERFQESARSTGLLPPRPIVALVVGRGVQVVQYATLAVAVGIDTTVVEALFAQGLNLVALAVGSLVPGQLGVSDGVFTLAAEAFGTTPAKAMSIALVAHVLQVLFVLVGVFTPMVWKQRSEPVSAPSPSGRGLG